MKRGKIFCYIYIALMCMAFLAFLPRGTKKASATGDMVLNLKFDGDLADSSGNAFNGECTTGKITYEEGVLGNCAVFDGRSYVEVQDTDALDLKDSFTISLWAYKEKMKDDYVPFVYKEEDQESWATPYSLYEHWKNSPGIYLHDGGAGSELDQFYLDSGAIDIRKWFLLTATYDGTEVRLYHNNLLTKRYSVTGVPGATTGNLYIGMLEGSLYFKGKMDDLRIYSRALSANEVDTRYNEGVESNPYFLAQTNALVAHYKFENDFKDATDFDNDAVKVTGAGTIKFVDAINGKGAKFAKGSYLEVEDDDSINFDEGFSVTGWVCVSKSDVAMTVLNRLGASAGETSNDPAYGFYAYDNLCQFQYTPFIDNYTPENSYNSFDSSLKNKWYHFGVTFSGDEIRWYKNGVLVNKEEIDEIKIAHASGNLMIGSDGEYFLEGTMDELKLYNYPLSDDEVKADANRKDSLSISRANLDMLKTLKEKGTVKLTASRNYIESGSSMVLSSGVTFKSSNSKIFKVSKDGVITAIKKGSAKLTITHGGISKTYTIKIK